MPIGRESLLVGRNQSALTDRQIKSVINTFIGLDQTAVVRYTEIGRTVVAVRQEANEEICEIIFGPDIYPGTGVIDPNSSLSMNAAAAHELTHRYRYENLTELRDSRLAEIDEALTSLEAIQRFPRNLSEHEGRQLIADAIQRLQIFAQNFA